MTNEERDIITQFISRVSGTQQAAQPSFGGGSVPATRPQALPPVDPQADRLIGDLMARYPESRYRLTQLAFVQEQALNEAQNRLQRMEWELQQARQAAEQTQQQPRGGGGFFSNLFGGGGRNAPPPQGGPGWGPGGPQQQGYGPQGYQQQPPPPQYGPGYQPGMFQQRGSGFLGSALTTAAGVAGGLIAGNALMNMFSGSSSGFGSGASSPWGGGGATGAGEQGYVDQGTWTDTGSAGAAGSDPGYVDNGNWDNSANDSWNSGGGGWDSGGGSEDDTF